MNNCAIGLFDSGVGGLTVLDAVRKILPCENYIYLADSQYAPYGDKSTSYILDRAAACIDRLQRENVKLIVIACNTATNVAVDALRAKYTLPIVGVEPAVAPAVRDCKGGHILVLVTESTAKQDKFTKLIDKLDCPNIIVSPQHNLAMLIEKNINQLSLLDQYLTKLLNQCDNLESIVLGCTHYVHLLPHLQRLTSYKARIYDGNIGVAMQVSRILSSTNMLSSSISKGITTMI